jgi:hypothetical protein
MDWVFSRVPAFAALPNPDQRVDELTIINTPFPFYSFQFTKSEVLANGDEPPSSASLYLQTRANRRCLARLWGLGGLQRRAGLGLPACGWAHAFAEVCMGPRVCVATRRACRLPSNDRRSRHFSSLPFTFDHSRSRRLHCPVLDWRASGRARQIRCSRPPSGLVMIGMLSVR